MRKSYVNERSITAQVEIGLDDITGLIDLLNEAYPETDSKNYRSNAMLRKLNQLRRDIAEEARREFESMSNS